MELKKNFLLPLLSLIIFIGFFGVVSAEITDVTITNPSSGVFLSGTETINWDLTGVSFGDDKYNVDYFDNTLSQWVSIATQLSAGSTSVDWDTTQRDDDVYMIRVQLFAPTLISESVVTGLTVDNTNPTIQTSTLMNPNGEEIIAGGSTFEITWNSADITDTNLGSNPITLEYSTDISTWISIATGEANGGSFTWTVASIDSATVEVRITATDLAGNSVSDKSDAVFEIDSTTPSIISYIIDNPTISPNGDNIDDSASIDLEFSETSNYNIEILDSIDNVIESFSGTALNPDPKVWDGTYSSNSTVVPDGIYNVKVELTDSAGNTFVDTSKTITVDTSVIHVGGGSAFATIQAAIDAASSGDTIEVAAGTYIPTLTINVNKQLKLVGESTSGVIITSSSVSYGIRVTADDVHMERFTLEDAGTYGLKIESLDNITLKDLTVQNSGISEVDLNQVTNSLIENVKANGQNTGGVGIALTNSSSIELKDIHTLNNNWGGVGLFDGSTGSTQDIIFSGTNTFEEANKVYVDAEFKFGVSNIILPEFTHSVENPTFRDSSDGRGEDFTFYQQSESDAISFALALKTPLNSSIQTLTPTDGSDFITQENNFVVANGMSIQAAIDAADAGATINVAIGTYNEQITIDKSLTLTGDVGDASAGPGINAPILDGENVAGDGIKILPSVSDVTIEGFIIRNYASSGNGIGNAIQAWVNPPTTDAISNVIVRHNRMENLGWDAVLVGSEGQAIHTGWILEYNLVSGSAFVGLELTNAQNSLISNNDVTTTGVAGILLQARNTVSGSGMVIVDGNEISDNSVGGGASSIYLLGLASEPVEPFDPITGAQAELTNTIVSGNTVAGGIETLRGIRILGFETGSIDTITVSGNTVTGADIGILVDGDVTGTAINNNNILGNDIGLDAVNGIKPAIEEVNAEDNWWGSNQKSTIQSGISGLVDFTPWAYNSNVDTDHNAPTTTIDSPVTSSWQKEDFTVSLTDTDTGGAGLALCKYRIRTNGAVTKNLGNRDCSLPVNVLVGLTSENHCEAEGADACKIEAFAIDNSGNEGLLVERTFSIDFTNPIIDTIDVVTSTNIATQTITGTFTEINIDTIIVNGVLATITGSTYSAANVPLIEGPNTITVVATDLAGNSVTDDGTSIALDTLLPEITGLGNFSVEVDSSISVTATVTDSNGINSVTLHYTIEGESELTEPMTPSGDNYTGSIPSQSSSTTISYFVVAQDNAGNTQTSSTFTILVNDLIWELDSTWNLVSVPKTLAVKDKGILLPGNTVHKYDVGTGTWVTNPTTINPGVGYWVDNSPETQLGLDFVADCTGPECLPSETITLGQGWNLIGHMCTKSQNVTVAVPPETYNNLFVLRFNETAGPDGSFEIYATQDPESAQFDQMVPGEGYWVFVPNGDLVYTNTC